MTVKEERKEGAEVGRERLRVGQPQENPDQPHWSSKTKIVHNRSPALERNCQALMPLLLLLRVWSQLKHSNRF